MGASDGVLRYVAIGDSLSEGVGDDPWPDGTPRGWADRLAEILSAHHGRIDYANFAVRGYRADVVRRTQLAPALGLDPDLVTLTAGMNDLLGLRLDLAELRRTLVDIVAPFTTKGARLLVVPIPDVSGISPTGRLISRRRSALNGIYRYLAEEHGMLPPAETTGTVFEDRRAWADDRLHLSPLGHQRLAVAAAEAFGVPAESDWSPPPEGAAPRRTLRGEVDWWRRHATPWVGRRLTGRSTGDGRTAKVPELMRLTAPAHPTRPRGSR